MTKKKIKHYRTPKVQRMDALNMDPKRKYRELTWMPDYSQPDYEALTDRYKHDAIARKIVSKPAEDATRNDFRIVIPGKADLQNAYQQALDGLDLQRALSQQIIFERTHGDGYLTIGVQEINPTFTEEPIDVHNLANVAFVHAFGQNHIKTYQTNDDPTSVNYGKESALVIQPQQPGYTVDDQGNPVQNQEELKPIVIDKSRYCHISLDKFEDDLVGTSIIKRCEAQLNAMSIALETVGKILREYTFKIVKSDAIMSETDDKFQKDKDSMSRSLNTEATAFIGSEDDIVKLSTSTNGINVLLDFAWQNLAAASNIPKSVLTGEQAGTLAGASQDVINYYDGIRAMQEQVLKPEIEKITRLLMWSRDVGGGPLDPDSIDWHIEFKPLWTPDDKTQAEIELTKAQTAGLLVDKGIYGPDEIREQLNGQANNAIQGMQFTGDSEEDIESRYTQDQVEQYHKDLEAAHSDD